MRRYAARWLPCGGHVAAMWLPRGCHVAAIWLSCGCRVAAVWLPRGCHVAAMWLPWRDRSGSPKAAQWCPKGSSPSPVIVRRKPGDNLATVRPSSDHSLATGGGRSGTVWGLSSDHGAGSKQRSRPKVAAKTQVGATHLSFWSGFRRRRCVEPSLWSLGCPEIVHDVSQTVARRGPDGRRTVVRLSLHCASYLWDAVGLPWG